MDELKALLEKLVLGMDGLAAGITQLNAGMADIKGFVEKAKPKDDEKPDPKDPKDPKDDEDDKEKRIKAIETTVASLQSDFEKMVEVVSIINKRFGEGA